MNTTPRDPAQPDRGLTPEAWELIDAARARRRMHSSLEDRWYPDDREGTKYATGDRSPDTPSKESDQ